MSAISNERRLARMRRTWQAAAPSRFEVAAARQRLLARQRPAENSLPRLLFDLGSGMAVATVVLFAVQAWAPTEPEPIASMASGAAVGARAAADPARQAGGTAVPAPGGANLRAALGGPRIERAGATLEAAPGVSYEVSSGETAVIVVGSERTTVVGPKFVEFTFEADRASGFRVHISDPELRSDGDQRAPMPGRNGGALGAGRGLSASTAVAATQLGAWSRAAEALRRGDQAGAEGALEEVAKGNDSRGADAAALALAQLWVSRGEHARARPVLERLEREGRTTIVQRRAAELLGR